MRRLATFLACVAGIGTIAGVKSLTDNALASFGFGIAVSVIIISIFAATDKTDS